MKLINKKYEIDKTDKNIGFIENTIKQSGFEPLRWSIVEAHNEKIIIDAVVIEK